MTSKTGTSLSALDSFLYQPDFQRSLCLAENSGKLFYLAEQRDKRKSEAELPELSSTIEAWPLSRCSNASARAYLPFEIAQKHGVLPLYVLKGSDGPSLYCTHPAKLQIAEVLELEKTLRFVCGCEVHSTPTECSQFEEAIFYAYHSDDVQLMSLVEQLARSSSLQASSAQALSAQNVPGDHSDTFVSTSLSPRMNPRASEAEIPQFLCGILDYAISHHASDLHLSARPEGGYLKLRCRGLLMESQSPACSTHQFRQILNRIRVLSGLKHDGGLLPQDGAFEYSISNKQYTFRVSILPSLHGESCVIRFPGLSEIPSLEQMGLSPRTCVELRKVLHRREGLVLFSGPTGSGKTTSMYALLQEAKNQQLHIISIEDPVERSVPGATQVAVNEAQGLSFSTGLRSALRQDPDLIMLGEIRDSASALQAFQAAVTGHIVLATIHARSIRELNLRLQQLEIPPTLSAQALDVAISQRLVPHLCADCKRPIPLPGSILQELEQDRTLFEAIGCANCDYSGVGERKILEECLVLNGQLRKLLVTNAMFDDEVWREITRSNAYIDPQEKLQHWLEIASISAENYDRFSRMFSLE
jgi:type II secretory ATPase GspE/PulE/Tfp pilus assembly ATPase PilB-like protein